jgi:hypothetical protein
MRQTRPTICCVTSLFLLALIGAAPSGAGAETNLVDAPPSTGSGWSLLGPGSTDGQQIIEPAHLGLNHEAAVQLAQAAPDESERAAVSPAESEHKGESLTEINKQLSNPVTSFWSLTFQFNNYNLENGHWNHNMQFQPVLPISLSKDWNLINRPLIPVYNSVPHPIAPGKFRQTTSFGDLADVEMVSPGNAGPWLLALGPTFIFPTAGSQFAGQGKYQIGPAGVAGYLAEKYIAGIFPQAFWSVSGGSRPAVAQLNLQPFYSYFLGEGYSVGYSGNVLANLHASTGQMWTVPIGLALAKVQKLGPLPVRFALAGQYMAVRPSDFGQEWNVQLVIAPVIPKLFKGSIF